MSEASTTPEADSLAFAETSESVDAASWIGRMIDGRYRITRILGEGGMGAVFEAEHLTLQKAVALKVVHAHFVGDGDVAARFAREAMASARLEHPHVASAMDFGTLPDGQAYLVMQLARGRSLGSLLEGGRVPWPKACEIAAQIADALAAAHAEGIVHRDLKPDNVMLMQRDDGTELVKVLDFGIARVGDDGRGRSRPPVAAARITEEKPSRGRASATADIGRPLTHVGTIIGTPGYMAPEQAVGQAVDHRVDLYALGVVLWEMIVGESLFPEEDLSEIITRQFTETPKLVCEATGDTTIPGELEGLVAHLLSRSPDDRPARASDVRDNLRQLMLRASLVEGALPEAIAASNGIAPGRITGAGMVGSRPTFAGAETARTLHAAHAAEIAMMTDARPREPLLDQIKRLPRPLLFVLGAIPVALVIGVIGLLVRLYSNEPLIPRPPQVVAGLLQKAREVAEPSVPEVLEKHIEALLEADERATRRDAAVAILAFEPATAVPAYASAAAELELGRTCNDRKIALARIAATGDLRLLPVLRRFDETPRRGCGFLRNRDCHGCIREDIARAMLTIDPTSTPLSAGR